MRDQRGFTLIELLVTMAVVFVLLLVMGRNLQGRMTAYQIEGQVKELKADLMRARERAMHRKHIHFVQINPGDYMITEDTNDTGALDGTPAPADTNLFSASKLFAQVITAGTGTFEINTRGLLEGSGTIRFDDTHSPDYDCLTLSPTRIEIGKMNGANCDVK